MFYLAIALLLIGLILIYLEFFLPGGIPATMGAISVIGSVATYCMTDASLVMMGGFALISLVSVVFACMIAFQHAKRTATIYLKDDQKGYTATSFEKSVIGKDGVAISPLRLSGHIEIEGVQYQAMSKNQFIEKGKLVRVVGGRGGYLLVKGV